MSWVTSKTARILFLFLFICCWGYHIPLSFAQVSVDIPPSDPIHEEIQHILNIHPLSDFIRGVGPYTLTEARHLLEELEPSSEAEHLANYLNHRGSAFMEAKGGIFATNAKSSLIPNVQARINPLLEQNEGRWNDGGVTGWAELRMAAHVGDWAAIDITPLIPLGWSNEGGGTSLKPELFSASIKLGHGDFETQIGKFPIRWGQAESGSFLFGGSQKPFPQIQFRNTIPARLPSFLEFLGPIQFSALVGMLDDQQIFPYSFFVGQHMSIKPQSWLELGLSQSVILGGKGSPDFSFAEGFLEVVGKRKGDINTINLSNRNFATDFRLQIPKLHFTTLYGEFIAEDCCAHLKRDISELLGVSIPNLTQQKLRLAFEWVRTTEILYTNGTYTSGYENENHLLGHTIGPDAYGYYLFAEHQLNDDTSLKWRFSFEQRGRERQATSEDRIQVTLQPTYRAWKQGWIRGKLGYEHIQNFRFLSNDTRNNLLGSIEASYQF